jgi:hypothetical protein
MDRRHQARPHWLFRRDCRAGGGGRTAHPPARPLAFLSPRIIAAIVDGTAPADLTVAGLAKALPYSWIEQEQRVGLWATLSEDSKAEVEPTVYEAIMTLEDTGVFSWVQRIDRVAERVKKRSRRSTVPCQKN